MNPVGHSFKITDKDSGERLDRFLKLKFPDFSRSHLQTLISNGNITLNQNVVKSGIIVKSGDFIEINFPVPVASAIQPENIYFEIIYEDDSIIVINKPAGLVVHPGSGNYRGTLVNGLLFHCKNLSGINGILRPGIVHRLDKNTSGLLVAAKTDNAHLMLSKQFETREIKRFYKALVWGRPGESKGLIETNIDRGKHDRKIMTVTKDSGRSAVTSFQILLDFQYFSLLNLSLETGRTHQIRVHLKHINHPVFGDPDYNGRSSQLNRLPSSLRKRGEALLKRMPRQALHAWHLQFIHPETLKPVEFESSLPEDMQDILTRIPQLFGLE